MRQRSLGRSRLQVAPLAFGGNVFGWTVNETVTFALLDAFVAGGFNLIDTADQYSRWVPGHVGGESETLIGRWLKRSGKRERVLIATKVGQDMGQAGTGLGRAHILRSCDASLARLQTDRIDLYQVHLDDPDTPLEETLSVLAELVRAGKVRAIGCSNYSAPRLAEALAISARLGLPRFESVQPLHNLIDRRAYEDALEPLCLQEGLATLSYVSLARGFLTGKYRSESDLSQSVRGTAIQRDYFHARGLRILDTVVEVAQQLDVTPAQVALAWQLARPGITAAIVSATKVTQWEQLARTVDVVLTPGQITALNAVSSS